MATNPTLLTQPIAANGAKNVIPNTTATPGAMSQDQGFPAETSLPLGAGGVAPSREDFNGAFNLLSSQNFMTQKGWVYTFDAGQAYYAGCIIRDTTDGKLYECINDVAAGGSVPSADAVNWKEYGVDPSLFANPDLSNLSATGENHFLAQDFTIIYPNGGTEANPANVTANSRYVETNPFAGYIVNCVAEVLVNGEWGNPEWFTDKDPALPNGDYRGVKANQLNDGNIVVQTASRSVLSQSFTTGSPFGYTDAILSTLPCRVKVWKIGKVASA